MQLPDDVQTVLRTLQTAGYEAYVVGGAVRDFLLGKTPTDYDICSSADPETVMALFPHTVPTGLAHGTVTVVCDSRCVEVTRFRADGAYADSRHPDKVRFVSSLKEDVLRRDFTVNAMAATQDQLVDFTGGQQDLRDGLIRAVGDPEVRFTEDALRILRCFRFAAVLGFSVEPQTKKAALSLADRLRFVSSERIAAELSKALTGQVPTALNPLIEAGGFAVFGIRQPLFDGFDKLPLDLDFRLAVWLGDGIESILKALKYSNEHLRRATAFAEVLSLPCPTDGVEIKKRLGLLSPDDLKLCLAGIQGLTGTNTQAQGKELDRILADREPYRLEDLALSGNDVAALGYRGKEIGLALQKALDRVIRYPDDNTKDALISFLSK